MIRYDIDFEALERAIDRDRPTWRRRASRAVTRMRAAKPRRFDDSGPSWSDIKHLYIELQAHKCAYCERELGSAIEHDVEHYRPKCAVEPWRGSARGIALSNGNRNGYCLLAYELRNYCMVCKTCNSVHKRAHFPIAGEPGRTDASNIAELNAKERPMLLYPLGCIDEDPEDIIKFGGCVPMPRYRSGHRRRRAQVTIELLALDQRTDLIPARCRVIVMLWLLIEKTQTLTDATRRQRVREALTNMLRSGREPHTACGRAFMRLFETDPDAAYNVYQEALEHLSRTS